MTSDNSVRPLTVGLVAKTKETDGGASNYENNLLSSIRQESSFEGMRFVVFRPRGRGYSGAGAESPEKRAVYSLGVGHLLHARMLAGSLWPRLLKILGLGKLSLERSALKKRVDILYFLSPNQLAAGIRQTPMINTVWDLGHLDEPAFPEVSANGEWASRQGLFQNVLPRSFHVFTDSDFTGSAIERYFQVSAKRWTCLGLFPPSASNSPGLIARTGIARYVIYPAQFWPHKNHITLVRAFKLVADKVPDIRLVLTGGDKGNKAYVLEEIRKLNLQDRVDVLGFVPENQLKQLISDAAVLAMPSLLGPTNIPPLEALAAGTVAIVSDRHHFDSETAKHLRFARGLDSQDWAEQILSAIKLKHQPVEVTNPQAVGDLLKVLEDFRTLRGLWR